MKILLGDNQFFGVNHINLDKAKETQQKFSSVNSIVGFIKESLELGLDGFMINSNDLGFKVVKQFNFKYYFNKECHYSVPYPHKYAAMVNESGIMALLPFVLKNLRLSDLLNALKFSWSLNAIYLLPTIIRLEIPQNLPTGSVIYLQNVITDLIMGLKNGPLVIKHYVESVEKMGYRAGIITLNPLHFRRHMESYFHDKNLFLCFNINKTGFNVFPSVQEVVDEINYLKANTQWQLVGMSIFSSGSDRITIEESIDFIQSVPLDYVVFGTSKLINVQANLKTLTNENN